MGRRELCEDGEESVVLMLPEGESQLSWGLPPTLAPHPTEKTELTVDI